MSDLQLKLRLVEAHGLSRDDPGCTSCADPFVIAKFRGLGKILSSVQSSVIHYTVNPVWNEDFNLYPKSINDVLYLKVYDHDSLSKDNLIGMVEIPLENMYEKGVQDIWLQLMKRRGAWKTLYGGHPTWNRVDGQIHIKLWFGLSSHASGLSCPKAIHEVYHQLQGQYTPTSFFAHYLSAASSSSLHDSTSSSSQVETYKGGYHPVTSPYSSPSTSSSQLPTMNTSNNMVCNITTSAPSIQVQ